METGIRVRTLIGACLAAALPCLALAGPPANTSMAMGEIEGIMKFCVRAAPEHAKELEQQMSSLTNTLSPSGVRGTAAYQQGYDLVTDALVKVEPERIRLSCTSIVSGKEHGEREEKGEEKGEKAKERPESDHGRR
jgi:hypothetical protein